jgi:hypothetical protein
MESNSRGTQQVNLAREGRPDEVAPDRRRCLACLAVDRRQAADVPSKRINVATSEKWGRHELKAGSRAVGKLGQDIKAWPPIFKY